MLFRELANEEISTRIAAIKIGCKFKSDSRHLKKLCIAMHIFFKWIKQNLT